MNRSPEGKSSGQSGNRAIGQRPGIGSDFRQMAVWKESQAFAAEVASIVDALPRSRSADVVGSQLMRAASSIAANIAEGYGRYSQAAYRNHLSIARGSAFECESWIDLLVRRGHVPENVGGRLTETCSNIQRMITMRMRGLAEAKQTYALHEGQTYEV